MRMTVNIDDELIKEAKTLTGKRTKKEVIEEALKELVRKKKREKLIEAAGRIEMDIDLEELLKLREQG